MPLDSPYLVYGVISQSGVPYVGATVYVQDSTLGSAVLEATTDSFGQYSIDISSIATDGDFIIIWCNLADSPTGGFTLDITGAMYECDLNFIVAGFITLTQTPTAKNLYLYPNGSYRTCCTPVGDTPNYECVDDPYDIPDDDSTYVYHATASSCTDLYMTQDHTGETGTINYVKVYARAKSHLYQQATTGKYRILCVCPNLSSTTAYSSDIDITTDYSTYSTVLTSTPSGGTWNWRAVDNMRIGFDCSSPATTRPVTTTFRPTGAGAINELSHRQVTPYVDGSGDATNYGYVDDEVADTNTFVYGSLTGVEKKDAYNIPAHTTETGTITSLSVFFKAKGRSPTGTGEPLVYIGGGYYYGTAFTMTDSWGLYSYSWTVNPNTTGAWSWANIDDVQIGVRDKHTTTHYTEFTQVYAVVTHNESVNPEIRTTQVYAVVNYTPDTASCNLNQPTRWSISNSRKVGIVQPERGDRKVYDLCRDSKVLTMEGIEYNTAVSTATARMKCVRDQKDNGMYVTISGVGSDKVDTTWLITDFTWDRDEKNLNIWHWVLTAEKYESG